MARRTGGIYMTSGEQLAGMILFAVYLLVLPFLVEPFFHLVGKLFGTTISDATQNILVYYTLFAATLVIFHRYLYRTTLRLFDDPTTVCKTILIGLVALYGINELLYRLTHLVKLSQINLNDCTISAQIDTVPKMTTLIVVLLAPVIEETLFRGLVFGNLKIKGRALAYIVSCMLFALLHVWQFAVGHQDLTYFVLMIQYLVPGLLLAWAYDYSGSLWAPIGLHAAANALCVLILR